MMKVIQKMMYLILYLSIVWSCAHSEDDIIYAESSQHCYHDGANYNLSLGAWPNEKIAYYVVKYDYMDDFDGYENYIDRTAAIWSEHIGRNLYRVYDIKKCDIMVQVEKMDGIGGVLGKSWFPPISGSSVHPVPIRFDYYDVATVEGRTAFDFFQFACMNLDTLWDSGTRTCQLRSCTSHTSL